MMEKRKTENRKFWGKKSVLVYIQNERIFYDQCTQKMTLNDNAVCRLFFKSLTIVHILHRPNEIKSVKITKHYKVTNKYCFVGFL